MKYKVTLNNRVYEVEVEQGEAMLVDAMVSGKLSPKEAVAAVLADENNSYSKNELKAAALNLKRMFGG